MALHLAADVKRRLYADTQAFFSEQFEEDLGQLRFELLLDFTMRSLGVAVYNQALADAQAYLQVKLLDMDVDLHASPDDDGVDAPSHGDIR